MKSYGQKNKSSSKTEHITIHLITYQMTLQFDGGSAPNPGPTAGAFVIYQQGVIVAEGGIFIKHGTNNIGEYNGLLLGLKKCKELGITEFEIQGDSMLVISQITGKWKVRHPNLIPIHREIMELLVGTTITCTHIRREYNGYADSLSDKTLTLQRDW